MKEEISLFSRDLDPDHLKDALEIKYELVDLDIPTEDILINTKELYELGFKFPNVATYDNVQA